MSDSVPPKLPPELFLRIQCPRCRQFQAVSLADKPKSHPKCHQCGGTIPLPRLNRKVRGVEVVLKAYPTESKLVTMRLPCPGCASFLIVSPEVAGQRRRCENCHTWFRLDLMKEILPDNPVKTHTLDENYPEPAASSQPSTAGAFFVEINEEPTDAAPRHPSEARMGRNPGSSPPDSTHDRQRQPPRPPPPHHHHFDDWDDEEPEDEDDLPVLVEHSEMRYQSHVADHSNTPVLPYRLIYRTIGWSLVFGIPIFAIYMAAAHHAYIFLIVAIISWFLPGLKIPGRLANLFMSLCFRRIRCPGCRQVYPAVARWSCPCGYNSPREKNVFHFRCPQCREYFGGFNCSHCQSSILIR